MGSDTLINRTNGTTIDQDFLNLFNRVLQGVFLGRDSSGAPTPGQDLGSLTIPWGIVRANALVLDGSSVDPALLTASPNAVISGKTKSTSQFPDYITPAGSGGGPSFTVAGATTNLNYDVNGVEYSITTDIAKGTLNLAPTTNNTVLVNDTSLTGQESSKNIGENGTTIIVDNMGSELTAKIGQMVALKNQTSGELFICRVKSAGILDNAKRGFFLNSAGSPIYRAAMNNNEVLQLLTSAYIFADQDGTTIDVTYNNPTISGNEPSGTTGDYWYDLGVESWKRYDGALWQVINRTYIGLAVIDTADCLGARSLDFRYQYNEFNSCEVNLKDVDTMITDKPDFLVSINGNLKNYKFGFLEWDASSDFETGVTRAVSTTYYLYITETGKPKISDKKPYDDRGLKKGFYHPFESWRAVASVYNNSSNEFEIIDRSDKILESPIGTVIPLAYDDGSAPEGYIRTDGSSLGKTAYSALFRRLQYVWGGSGSNFTLPDDRGVFMRGLDSSKGYDTGRVFGVYQADAIVKHGHDVWRGISGVLNGFSNVGGGSANDRSSQVGHLASDIVSDGINPAPNLALENIVKNNTRIFAIRYK